MSLVRPSVASLNSLAEVLRNAQPLYAECRSILNYLDHGDGIVLLPPLEGSITSAGGIPASNDAASIPQTVFEHRTGYGKGIVYPVPCTQHATVFVYKQYRSPLKSVASRPRGPVQ